MKKTLLLSAIMLQAIIAGAQKFEWLSHSSQASLGAEEYAPVAVDPAGNIYTAIQTTSTGIVIQGNTFTSLNGANAIIVVKLDPAGNLIWGKTISGDGAAELTRKIAVDNAGAVYISVIMIGANAILNDTVYPITGSQHIIKIDSSGNFIRAIQFAGIAFGNAQVAILGTDLYMTYAYFIQKMDSAFNVIWTVTDMNSVLIFSNGGGSADLFVQTNGELIFSAYEGGTNNIGPIPFGNDTVPFTAGPSDEVAVIKMDTSGQVLWARTVMSPVFQTPQIRAVALDHQGNAYAGIYNNLNILTPFAGDTILNPFNSAPAGYAAILKWDASGNETWARGLYHIWGGNGVRLLDLAINAQEEVLVSGYSGNMSFNNDTIVNASSANSKCFLLKCNSSGTYQWYKTETNIPTGSIAEGIAVRNGNEYILGGTTHNIPGIYAFGCFQYPLVSPTTSTYITMVSEQPECNPSGINETTDKENKTAVYPNPTDGILTLSFKGNENESCNIDLIDVSGRIILNEKVIAVEGANKYQMDLRSVAKGIYVLLLKSEGMNEMVKVVVE